MPIRSDVDHPLPFSPRIVAENIRNWLRYGRSSDELHEEFVDDFFSSRREYEGYVEEFEEGPISEVRDESLRKYRRLSGKEGLSDIGLDAARDYYAVARELKPDIAIETGVCNGVSTLSVLLALQENQNGTLYTIDYPLRADESLEEFREETFDDYGGAAIPSDKEPGWIIPTELRTRWDSTIGKSQRELPKLIAELGTVDLFMHDSEHSHPCMMFEYELVYEWLEEGGVILSDDITWNEAFSTFVDVRKPEYGYLSYNIGYVKKTGSKEG